LQHTVFCTEFFEGCGLDSRCVGRVCGADGAVHGTIRTLHTTYAAALKTTTHQKTRCRKTYAATQHLMLLKMGVCTRNMSSYEYSNKIILLHEAGISNYFMKKMHGQITLKCQRIAPKNVNPL
jgi:hypothetical protein